MDNTVGVYCLVVGTHTVVVGRSVDSVVMHRVVGDSGGVIGVMVVVSVQFSVVLIDVIVGMICCFLVQFYYGC